MTYRTLVVSLLLIGGCAYGGTVNCIGSSGDASAIQSAVNAGGTVTISGACSITSRINVTKPVIVNGSATLNVLPSLDYAFAVNSDNVTFNGLTFVGAGIYATGANSLKRSNITITNNIFRDFTVNPYKAGIETDRIAYNWNISGNAFKNFWKGGFSNTTTNPGNNSGAMVAGIVIWGGLDHTIIDNNSFDEFENDSMHFFNQGLIAYSGGYTATGVVISNNFFTRQHRMAIEYQDASSSSACAGGCNNSAVANTGTVIKNNYFHLPAWPWPGVFAWSVPTLTNGAKFYNNTAIAESIVGAQALGNFLGFAWELGPSETNLLLEGNVVAEVMSPYQKWGAAVANYPPGTSTNVYTNNLFCGYFNGYVINNNTTGGGANTQVANIATKTGTCPGGVGTATSSINAVFTSPNNQTFLAGDVGTWNVSVVSNLSIKCVQFFIDGSTTPAVTQEIQDVNKNFPNDRTWLYHASINTSAIAPGSHTLTAKAIDVSGALRAISQSFTVN